MNRILFFMLFLLINSCSSEKSPDDALRAFVNYRFSSGQTKEGLLQRTTGKMYAEIEGMSEESINKFIDTEGYKRKNLKINLQKCSAKKCYITYTLFYSRLDKSDSDFEVEVKKIAELELVDEKWKVSSVSNVKTFIDSKNPIKP